MPEAGAVAGRPTRAETLEELRGALEHPHPAQLWYQLEEIVEGGLYLRHGIEVGEGDVVFDVGANVGVAAAFFAVGCGAGAVHSFEPVPPVFELLRRNLSRYPACTPHPYGLSSADGPVEITYYPLDSAMSSRYADPERDEALVRRAMLNRGLSVARTDSELEGRYRPVPVSCEMRALSSVLRDSPVETIDLLKIDVERAEADVLAGIEEDDWPLIRQIVVEVHDQDGRLGEIAAAIEGRGYRVATEQEEGMRGTDLHMLYGWRR